jgi:hypothetical protein
VIAGVAAVVSALFERRSLMVNDVDGQVVEGDDQKPTRRARLIYGIVGIASLLYGWHLLHT